LIVLKAAQDALSMVDNIAGVDSVVEGLGALLVGGVLGLIAGLAIEAATRIALDKISDSIKKREEELEETIVNIRTYGGSLRDIRISYDYNLYDENNILRKDNNYDIKVDLILGESPSGGGTDQRNERRAADDDGLPPDSVLEESYVSYNMMDIEVESQIPSSVRNVLRGLTISDSVEDSYQIETFYRLIGQEIINNSSKTEEVLNLVENKQFRQYFAGTNKASVKKYDEISSGFVKRLANRIATGRSYPEPVSAMEEAPGEEFLTPETPEPTTDDQESSDNEAQRIVLEYISPAFKFGNDPYKEPEIIYLDNETYGGPIGQLFPDTVPPPFYVQPPIYDGWLGLIEALLPTPSGCDPSTGPFFDLSDLKSEMAPLTNELIPDPRMGYDPTCTQEAPYDKIFANVTLSSIESLIRSVCRVYITSDFLSAIPVISQFAINGENYDEGIFEFIVDGMTKGLKEDGRKWTGASDNFYYYRFLEQVVNNIARKVQSEIINPEKDFNREELDAFKAISEKVLTWYQEHDGTLEALSTTAIMQQSIIAKALSNKAAGSIAGLGAGSADFSKSSAIAAKEAALELMVLDTEKEALVFLKRMVREEFLKMGSTMNERLYPPIQNIDHLFLLSDTWIRGGLNPDGPLNVMSDPKNPTKFSIPSGKPSTLSSAIGDLSAAGLNDFASQLETAFSDMEDWPFVLEKYVRIIDKDEQSPSVSRAENLYGIVNIDDWDGYVRGLSIDGNISDFWGNLDEHSRTTEASFHSHRYDVDEEGNGVTREEAAPDGFSHTHEIINGIVQSPSDGPDHTHELYRPAWKFGLRICYMPEKDSREVFGELMNTISQETVMLEKAFRIESPEGARDLIPICSAELDIPDQDLSLFDPDSYDVYCMIQELIKTEKYQTWFRYVFPLQRYLTVLTIYSMVNFVDSIGNTGYPENGGDLWETQGGNWFRDFRSWNRETFGKSRKAARQAFKSLYTTTQNDYEAGDPDEDTTSPSTFLELLKPLVNFEDGLRWWQRGRRISTKPTDADGNSC
jgi:hypothetical protein